MRMLVSLSGSGITGFYFGRTSLIQDLSKEVSAWSRKAFTASHRYFERRLAHAPLTVDFILRSTQSIQQIIEHLGKAGQDYKQPESESY